MCARYYGRPRTVTWTEKSATITFEVNKQGSRRGSGGREGGSALEKENHSIGGDRERWGEKGRVKTILRRGAGGDRRRNKFTL